MSCPTFISNKSNLIVINNTINNQIYKLSPFIGLTVMTDSPRFTVINVTDNFLNTYQKKEADVLEKSFSEIFEGSDSAEQSNGLTNLIALFKLVIDKKTPEKLSNFYCKLKEADGVASETICLDLQIIPVMNERDLPVSIIISLNATENKAFIGNLNNITSLDYQSMVENSLNAFFLAKPDGTILEANKAACDLFGRSVEEFRQIGREGIIDHSELLINEKLKERIDKGRVRTELVGVKKNGEKFPIEVYSVIFLNANGEQRTSTSISDITDRKNAENALKKSEYYLHEAQKLAKMGSWNFDIKEAKLTWTDGLYDVFGVNKENFLETYGSFINLVVDENRAFVAETSRQAQLTGNPFNVEYRIMTPNGENRVIEEFGYSEKNTDGVIVRLFGTAQDITDRKQAEQVLKLSEKKYKTIFEDNPLPMFIWDFETLDIIDCNKEALIKYGYTRDEFLRLNIRDIRPKEDVDLIDKATENERVYGQIHKETWRHLKKNGDIMLMEVTGHLMDYNGRRVSLVMLNDVTQYKYAEQQKLLLANISRLFNQSNSFSETLNQVLQAIVSAGNYCIAEVWMIDTDKKNMNLLTKHAVGDKAKLFYDDSSDLKNVAIDKGLQGLVWQTKAIQQWNVNDDNDHFIRKNEAIKAGIKKIIGLPLLYNETIIGSIILGSNSIEKIQNDFILQSNHLSTYLGAEIKRKQLEQELNQVFDYSQDIICIADFKGYFKKINPVAVQILGYTEEELLNRPFNEFVHPDDRNLTSKRIEALSNGEPTYYFENRYITKTGKTVWFAWTSKSSPEEKLIFAVAKDITDKKKLEEKLEEHIQRLATSNKELEQFAYMASHDLQEPLRMVTSFLDKLDKKYSDVIDDKGKQYIYFAVDGAIRMRQIILDLIEFSRASKLDNNKEQVNVNELVSDVILLYKNQIKESNATIEVGNLPTISVYNAPLSQVFQNLISNALKYRQNGKAPIIKINCTEILGHWMFSIKDNGIGINKDYFEKIFVIFQRLHNKDEYAGTGIGLAIVKKIINNLDGKIWLESEEGEGTVFYFTIPK